MFRSHAWKTGTLLFALNSLTYPLAAQKLSSSVVSVSGAYGYGTTFSAIVSGKIDPAALAIIAKHLNAIHSDTWKALQAKGSIQLGNESALPATLAMQGSDQVEITIQSGSGLRSIQTDGSVLTTTDADGKSATYGDQLGQAGILQFQWLRAANLSTRMLGLVDAGIVTIQGKQLYKMAMLVAPSTATTAAQKAQQPATQADFYFDPITLTLDRIVTPVRLPGSMNAVLQVTAFGDYRPISGALFPFTIQQSIDGQVQWTLSLTEASALASLSLSPLNF